MISVKVLLFVAFYVTVIYGKKPSKPDLRIMGGEPTTIEEYPYQVSIIYIDTHNCGGSIINPSFILTAAHCTQDISADDLLVRAGSTIVDEGGQIRQVARIFQHDKFDRDTFDFDISVLKLSQSLNLGPAVAVVGLPPQSEDVEGDIPAVATGWGRLYDNGPLPMELQKVILPTIAWDVCELVYKSRLTKQMFCAGYMAGQKDTCQGDSGGPLAADGVLVGITSWGDSCGAPNSPGVYTKVAIFRNYIDNIIRSN